MKKHILKSDLVTIYRNIRSIERRIFLDKENYFDIIRLSKYAKEGIPLAMIDYALCLIAGKHIRINKEDAIKYLSFARKDANGYELYLIGTMYLSFKDIPHYQKEAIKCLQRSVELGFYDSLDILSKISENC